MEDVFYMILGLFMIYGMVHFVMVQHGKTWKQRSGYERFLSVFAYVVVGLLFIASAGY